MATLVSSFRQLPVPCATWLLTAVTLLCVTVPLTRGHGYLYQPPGRSSAWRVGYNTTVNVDDNGLNCGGFGVQKGVGMKCGVCGDPWKAASPRDHEVGGKYADPVWRPIVGNYSKGQQITLKVHITAYHKGWIGFKVCPTNSFGVEATQPCLDQHPLTMANGSDKYFLPPASYQGAWYNVTFTLPSDVTCDLCVLQWRYKTGNSWGTDPVTGKGCLGCGDQEEFYACADISIGASGNPATSAPVTSAPVTNPPATNAPATNAPATNPPATNQPITNPPATNPPATNPPVTNPPATNPPATNAPSQGSSCRGKPGLEVYSSWCATMCPTGYCPPSFCVCAGAPPPTPDPDNCRSIGTWESSRMDTWCNINCNAVGETFCPPHMCRCD